MRVPLPQQISSVPQIDNGAMGWAAQLVDGLGKIRISELNHGIATITWPGGGPASNTIQVTHGLTRQSLGIFTQVNALSLAGVNQPPIGGVAAGASAQQFQVAFWTTDGQAPAAASSVQFYWLAIL